MSDIEKALAGLRINQESDGLENICRGSYDTKRNLAQSQSGDHIEPVDSKVASIPLVKANDEPPDLAGMRSHAARKEVERLSVDQPIARDITAKTGSASDMRAALTPEHREAPVPGVSHTPTLELPLELLQRNGYLVPGTAKGRLTEEYRRVKRPLLKNLRKVIQPENGNVVMVTSSISGEGKTYTAINLAMSFAQERDRTVLLVDGDVIKSSAGRVLGVDPEVSGLTDLLADRALDIGEVLRATNIPSLSFLPAGREHELANELLSSVVMSERIKELAERYSDRIIIIDSPPILQTNEANIITEYAGQVVFVVAEGDTPQKTVTQALAHIDKDKFVGILVNKAALAGKTYAYGYEYGYE